MPFARPTPQQIRDRIGSDVDRLLGGAVALFRRSVEGVLVRMVAIASHELHGHLSWISRQVLVDKADDEELERHADIWGIQRRQATIAGGRLLVTGMTGATVPGGAELRRSDDARYVVDESVVIEAGGTATASVTAVGAGTSGNAAIGSSLLLVSPIAGIQSAAYVIDDGHGAGLSGGREVETDASLRARILTRIQEPPHGGALHDYITWVGQVVGDTRAWVYPNQLGHGTVIVSFMMPDGSMPTATTVANVQTHIEAVRPVTADVTIIAPTVVPLNMQIRLSPDTALVRAAVLSELSAMIVREAEPGGVLPLSRVSEAISAATGEYSHNLLSPTDDVTTAFGHILRLGAVSWVVE